MKNSTKIATPLALASCVFAAAATAETMPETKNTAADNCVYNAMNTVLEGLAGTPGLTSVTFNGLDALKAGCEQKTKTELSTAKDLKNYSMTVKGATFTFK